MKYAVWRGVNKLGQLIPLNFGRDLSHFGWTFIMSMNLKSRIHFKQVFGCNGDLQMQLFTSTNLESEKERS